MSQKEGIAVLNTDDQEMVRLREALQQAVKRVCPGWLADKSDDLVQVGIIRVMEVQRKSEGNRSFSPSYYWRVAYSALVDEIRALRRRQEVPLTDDREEILVPPANTPNPEERYAGKQMGEGIQQCLFGLIRSRRLAVTLHLQGHSVPSAARLLGWTVKKTENLLYRGLSDLRQCLSSKGWSL